MKLLGFNIAGVGIFSILVLIPASPINAQTIYRWIDEKGQWYFSDNFPPGVNAEPIGRSTGFQARDLGRSYAGISLGKSVDAFLGGKDIGREVTDQDGVRYITLEKPPPETENILGVFVNGQLAAIEVDYSGLYVRSNGGWERMLWSTREKYGPAYLVEPRASYWVDNETALALSIRLDNGVKALYGDRKLIEQNGRFKKSMAPKF